MVASGTIIRLEETARDLFEVVTQLGLTALRGRRRSGDLKEVEFLTLAILQERGTMIVGDIQRMLGVLPAQMSRIIRSLEARDRPLIGCRINPEDKRKINVNLTPSGRRSGLVAGPRSARCAGKFHRQGAGGRGCCRTAAPRPRPLPRM